MFNFKVSQLNVGHSYSTFSYLVDLVVSYSRDVQGRLGYLNLSPRLSHSLERYKYSSGAVLIFLLEIKGQTRQVY